MRISKIIVWELSANFGLGLLYLYRAHLHWIAFSERGNFSSVFYLIFISTTAFFFFIRRFPESVSNSPISWTVALMGTWLPLLYLPVPGAEYQTIWIFQSAGVALQIWAIMSLNRSFGIVAADRGVKTGGMFAFLRHPLYASYLVSHASYVFNNISSYNIVVALTWFCFQLFRIIKEEQLLMLNEEYRQYATKVRWRLVPYVF
jgi:protein-S-isoprenylcysteine O-methyltransferase Ste14